MRTLYHATLVVAFIGFGVWLCWNTAPREPVALALRCAEQNSPGRDSQQVLKAERSGADATDRESRATTSPGVGPMGAGQPADAGPQRDLFAEVPA